MILVFVAALLTVIGYSLNDTIVILDRIRENRGKLPLPTLAVVNNSINQTVSRTVLTSFTTLLAVMIIFVAGGTGIRPFAFCLLVGILVGTYSSIAIASPIVFSRRNPSSPEADGDVDGDGYEAPPCAECCERVVGLIHFMKRQKCSRVFSRAFYFGLIWLSCRCSTSVG